jgi:hypothetical protein
VARSGQNRLAQGYPGLVENKRFALKGLETLRRSGSKGFEAIIAYLAPPSGLFGRGELPRVNPGSTLG